ncbi:hypothetical protein SEVIR_4G263900v4 [Setaria viridis]|uniref:Uncharacterized protein n=1 Tax=Setaria viridis TaxID=4556 RepID=A0A4V6D8R0_SETVI|nr:hypothetical protein SEVIR_4G263900v2 [Setaria viridis]
MARPGGGSGAGRGGWLCCCGDARPGRLLLERRVMCTSARKKGSVSVCLGPTACDSATMTYASMGYGSMDRDQKNMGGGNVGQGDGHMGKSGRREMCIDFYHFRFFSRRIICA